jgi:hypothetical protein
VSDQQTDVGPVRGDRRRDSLLDTALEAGRGPAARTTAGPAPAAAPGREGRQVPRARLPLPPLPAVVAVPAGPPTTAAPFQAVPSPEIPAPAVTPDVLAASVPSPAGVDGGRRRSRASSAPAAQPVRARRLDDVAALQEAPVRRARASAPAPRQTTPASAPSVAYGDWTKPSRADLVHMAAADEADYVSTPIRGLRPAPGTTAIPERSPAGRRARIDVHDFVDVDGPELGDAPSAESVPAGAPHRSGPPTGGRATRRAELQAADLARKEAAKRNGTPIISPLDEENPPRRSRVLLGLVAMVVVALGVLGVYQVTSPNAEEAASRGNATPTAPVDGPPASALPTLPTAPVVVEPTVSPDAKAPVSVLNATQTTGLAAKVAAAVAAGGWETPAVGQYPGTDVAASTVFFTEGDEAQRQAAVNLVNQFPQLAGPAPRFFEVPAGVSAPGLVVVTTGDWQP